MALDTIYVLTTKALFDEYYDLAVAGGYVNRGAIRFSLDDSLVLLEEVEAKFPSGLLKNQAVTTFTLTEAQDYMNTYLYLWEDTVI